MQNDKTAGRRTLESFVILVVVAGLLGCPSQSEGPPLCSRQGLERLRDAGSGDALLLRLCPDQASPPSSGKEKPDPGPWKSAPVAPSRIKTDPVSFLEKPVVIFVAVRPTDYFNYGYRNARETHFGFEIAQFASDDNVQPLSLYGYADRRWARPFFEKVSKELEEAAGQYQFVPATLVVTYKKSRYESSPDHLEILAAVRGEDRSVTPESRALGSQDSGAEAGTTVVVADQRQPTPAPHSGGPPEDQVLRDAKARVLAEQAQSARMGMGWRVKGFRVLPYDVDEFEKDSVTARVEVEGGFGPEQRGTCVLAYQNAGSFWKLLDVGCRYR